MKLKRKLLLSIGYILTIALLVPAVVFASDISNALWRGDITVTNNGTSTATYVSTNMTLNSASMIANGYAVDNMTDVAIQLNGTDVPFMPGYDDSPWALFISSISAGQNVGYDLFSSGATGGELRYFPTSTGMAVTDDASLELGDNFTMEMKGWVDTDNGSEKYLVEKPGSFVTYVSPTVSGNITSVVLAGGTITSVNMTPAGVGDYTNIAASTEGTHWEAVDDVPGLPDITTYVSELAVSSAADVYTLTANPLEAYHNIEAVAVHYRFRSTGIATASATPRLRLHGVDSDGTLETQLGDYVSYTENVTRPGGGKWVHTDFDTLQAGVVLACDTGGESSRLTQVYIIAYYSPGTPVSATGVSSGEHTVKVEAGSALGYDGNDYLKNATANFSSSNSSGAMEAWFRTSTTGTDQTFIGSADEADVDNYIYFGVLATNGEVYIAKRNGLSNTREGVKGTLDAGDGQWHHAVISASGTAWTIILDGATEAIQIYLGANTGEWFADVSLRDNLTVGGLEQTGVGAYNTGTIGWTRIYDREMAAPEALTNYSAGRNAAASDTTGLVFNLPLSEGTGNPVDTIDALTMTRTGATWFIPMDLYIDDVEITSTNITAAPDSSDNWTFLQNDAMPYMEYTDITTNRTQSGYWAWEYGSTFTDQAGNGNTATPTFRTTTSNANVTASLNGFQPVEQAQVSTFDLAASYAILSDTPTAPAQMYTELDESLIPGGQAADELLASGGVPAAAWWFPFMFLGISVIGLIAYGSTTLGKGLNSQLSQGRVDGSLVIMFVVIEVLLCIFGTQEVIPLAAAYLFPIAGIALILSRKHYSWG